MKNQMEKKMNTKWKLALCTASSGVEVSKGAGPNNKAQYTVILILGPPKQYPESLETPFSGMLGLSRFNEYIS